MTLASLSPDDLSQRLGNEGINLVIGPYHVRVSSVLPEIVSGIGLHYRDYAVCESPFSDFHLRIETPGVLRRWFRPQIRFSLDGQQPFKPMPRNQAFAALEWGLNWCISSYSHQYLIVHAAVIEKAGVGIVMPAQPGAGKSTLTAGLVSRGWRLLSDELALLTLTELPELIPVPRPINLKNESIPLMRQFAPQETIGPEVRDTAKGKVAHMRAPRACVMEGGSSVRPALIVFPSFRYRSETVLAPISRGRAFMETARQAFNFHVLGERGFHTLNRVISSCGCYQFNYSRMEEAIDTFEGLVDAQRSSAL